MFCTRSTSNKINKLHGRALRIEYDDYNSNLEDFKSNMAHSLYINKTCRHSK